MTKETIASLHKKHPPTILPQYDVVHIQESEQLGGTIVRGIIETPKLLVTEKDISHIKSGGAVVYPGRHASDKHPLSQLDAANIALYELDSSPWNRATANFVFTALDGICSGIPAMQANMLEGNFDPIARISLAEGTKFGIVGLGNIGEMVAHEAQRRKYEVNYYNRTRKYPFEQQNGISYKGLAELFQESDVISLNLPRTETTKGIINYDLLRLLKPHTILISTSASGVINENDLIKRMREDGTIRAAIDTFQQEGRLFGQSPLNPQNNDHVRNLVLNGNLLLTPHTAYKTTTSSAELLHVLAGPFDAFAQQGTFPERVAVHVPQLDQNTKNPREGKKEVYIVRRII